MRAITVKNIFVAENLDIKDQNRKLGERQPNKRKPIGTIQDENHRKNYGGEKCGR